MCLFIALFKGSHISRPVRPGDYPGNEQSKARPVPKGGGEQEEEEEGGKEGDGSELTVRRYDEA